MRYLLFAILLSLFVSAPLLAQPQKKEERRQQFKEAADEVRKKIKAIKLLQESGDEAAVAKAIAEFEKEHPHAARKLRQRMAQGGNSEAKGFRVKKDKAEMDDGTGPKHRKPPKHGMPKKSPEEMEKLLLRVVNDLSPKSAKELEQLKTTAPAAYEHRLRKMHPRFKHFIHMLEDNPAMYESHIQTMKLTFSLRRAMRQQDEEQVKQLTGKLEQAIGKRFELEYENRLEKIKRLEEKLEESRKQLEDMKGKREAFIKEKIDNIKEWKPRQRGEHSPRMAP